MKTQFLFGLVLSLSAQFANASPRSTPKGAAIALAPSPAAESFLYADGAQAVQGSEFNVFIRPMTDYTGSYIVLDAALDGNAVALEHPVQDLWIYSAPQFEMLVKHTLTFTISLENAGQADQVTQALCDVESRIQSVQTQIANATDPNQLQQLNAILLQDQTLQTQLTNDLIALKNYIGTQTYSFQVAAAPANSAVFPRITSISPSVGAVAGGTGVSITGANFTSGATVSIGGVAATNVVFNSATSLTATTAAFASGGVQDVVVTLPLASNDVEQKQALLANGFFAVVGSRGVLSTSGLFGGHGHGGPGFQHDGMCGGRTE